MHSLPHDPSTRLGSVRILQVAVVVFMTVLSSCAAPFGLADFLDGVEDGVGGDAAEGDVVMDQNFDSVPVGTSASELGFESVSDPGTAALVESRSGQNVLELTDANGSGQVYVRAPVQPVVQSRATVEYKVAKSIGDMWAHLELLDQAYAPLADFHINPSSDLGYTDHLGSYVFIANFAAEQLYHLRFQIDFSRQRFSLYLDGALVVNDAQLSSAASELAFVEYRTSISGSGSVLRIDDIKIVSFD